MAIHILTDQQLCILKVKGFIDRYRYYTTICETYVEAYEKTEEEYFKIIGEYKYRSYQSFRNSLKFFENRQKKK